VSETLRQVVALDNVGAMPMVVISSDRWGQQRSRYRHNSCGVEQETAAQLACHPSNSRFLMVPETDNPSLLSNKEHAAAVSEPRSHGQFGHLDIRMQWGGPRFPQMKKLASISAIGPKPKHTAPDLSAHRG
jgi:hypothetical protein